MGRRLGARLAQEGHHDLAHGVKGRHQRRERQHDKDQPAQPGAAVKSLGQDFVLAPKASGDKGQARKRHAAGHERPERPGHPVSQAAHVAHVLRVKMFLFVPFLAMLVMAVMGHVMMSVLHAVDDRAGTQKEQRLEESVRHEVKGGGNVRAHAQGRHHKAKLADGGIGQHLFDVVLGHGYRGREKGRKGANQAHGDHGRSAHAPLVSQPGREQREGADRQVHARRDHCRGVDEGADGRGAFHGVWQPHVQRELGALAHRACKDEQPDEARRRQARYRRAGLDEML